ncbi:MAG: indole-3-glycerol phosphate synthase TrpC [Acutalibacteraceae bacterium]
MSDILQTIADYARVRVEKEKEKLSAKEIIRLCEKDGVSDGGRFESALRNPGISFICEVKKASPSKGIIAEDFPYVEIAREYEAAGADCISCLTEPKWFLGSDEIFKEIRAAVSTPMLRKDFIVDGYQIYQSRLMGADAVLLICAVLESEKLKEYLKLCKALGLAALVEAHDEAEVDRAVSAGARIIGVNNRNLRDFSVDIQNSGKLRSLIPENIIFVAESGIRTKEDIEALKKDNVDAVLIGETLMRACDKAAVLKSLKGAV